MKKCLIKGGSLMSMLVLALVHLSAQGSQLSGVVLDSATKAPIPFANIGISGENVGTMSKEDGTFQLLVPDDLLNCGLTFSAITHQMKVINISAIRRDETLTVFLREKVTDLGEVVFRSTENLSKRILGIRKVRSQGCFTKDFHNGAQITQLIQAKDYPVKLSKIRLNIMMEFDPLLVRVRVFDLDRETGLPGEELLHENIIQPVRKRKPGWVEVDISEYDIWPENHFFVSVEFIKGGNFIFSCLNTEKYNDQQYVRMTSFGNWKKAEDFFTFKESTVMVIGAEVLLFN